MIPAANDSSRLPPLSELSETARERLKNAYQRTELERHGRSFDDAIADDCLRLALTNLAHALEHPRPE